ncbi:MAG: DUF1491 family protein [Rhizobiaceae bacterium]
MRVTSEFWVGALLRRAQAGGAFVCVLHKGAKEAGAIFVVINNLAGDATLLGPAPQMVYDETVENTRYFEPLLNGVPEAEVSEKIKRERSFDPDIWVIEIEDRQERSFIEHVIDPNA